MRADNEFMLAIAVKLREIAENSADVEEATDKLCEFALLLETTVLGEAA